VRVRTQSSLRDSRISPSLPGAEAPGYWQMPLRGGILYNLVPLRSPKNLIIRCGSVLQFAGTWERKLFAKRTLLPRGSREEPGKKLYELEGELQRELGSARTAATQERVADAYIASSKKWQE
jgi:hypothetical protein